MAEQVAVDEAELEGLQQPRHAAHVDVRLVEEPLEGRLGARVDRQGVRKEVVHLGWGWAVGRDAAQASRGPPGGE